jgi:hypothetical protein
MQANACKLSVARVSSCQEVSLLASGFRDSELMAREAVPLERWIES